MLIHPDYSVWEKVEYLVWWHTYTASMWEAEARDYLHLRQTWAIYPVTETQTPLMSYPVHFNEEEVASLI